MSIRITGKSIRATGSDANSLFIAMSPDETLIKWDKQGHGSEEFQKMVKEALVARGLSVKEEKL